MTPSLTDGQVNSLLRAFLLLILPQPVEVLIGQANRVGEPPSDDYVVFWSTLRKRLGTTVQTWDESHAGNPAVQSNTESLQITMQLDFHGSQSTDLAQTFATLFRSDYACQYWSQYSIQPDYCSDGQQMPFINGEDAYEDRWTLSAVFDANISIVSPQQFADTVTVGLINVDEKYPPS